MVFFTSICANYFDKAAALGLSIKRHMPNAKFLVGLVEEFVPDGISGKDFCDEVVLSHEIGIQNFPGFMFKHRIVEASTSIKPSLTLDLMNRYPDEKYFVFLDPDCYVFCDFEKHLITMLEHHSIALTPHLLSPGNVDMEISSLKHGVFNLGFYAIKRSEEGERFLKWWGERLHEFCYEDFNAGLFTDQKWINLAVAFFDPKVIRDPGYNFATWNFMERQLSKSEKGLYFVDGAPLKFVHFSGHDKNTFEWAAKRWGNDKNVELGMQLAALYRDALSPFEGFRAIKWSYSSYADGSPISDEERIVYRQNQWRSGDRSLNPFTEKVR